MVKSMDFGLTSESSPDPAVYRNCAGFPEHPQTSLIWRTGSVMEELKGNEKAGSSEKEAGWERHP